MSLPSELGCGDEVQFAAFVEESSCDDFFDEFAEAFDELDGSVCPGGGRVLARFGDQDDVGVFPSGVVISELYRGTDDRDKLVRVRVVCPSERAVAESTRPWCRSVGHVSEGMFYLLDGDGGTISGAVVGTNVEGGGGQVWLFLSRKVRGFQEPGVHQEIGLAMRGRRPAAIGFRQRGCEHSADPFVPRVQLPEVRCFGDLGREFHGMGAFGLAELELVVLGGHRLLEDVVSGGVRLGAASVLPHCAKVSFEVLVEPSGRALGVRFAETRFLGGCFHGIHEDVDGRL